MTRTERKGKNDMTTQEIYGRLLTQGIRAPDIARDLGVSISLVSLAVRGLRDGERAREVRAYVAGKLGVSEDELPREAS